MYIMVDRMIEPEKDKLRNLFKLDSSTSRSVSSSLKTQTKWDVPTDRVQNQYESLANTMKVSGTPAGTYKYSAESANL